MATRKGSAGARRLTPEGAARRARIIEMRRKRMTFAEIARQEGISDSMVHKLYRQALAEIPAYQIDEHRAEELELIDTAINRLLAIAEDGDVSPRTRVEAWSAIRGWAERKAKLLGLDAPLRTEIVTLTEIDAEIRRLEAELSVQSASDDEELADL